MKSFQRIFIVASVVVVTAGLLSSLMQAQTPAPARETYADLPGVRIWYKDSGGSGVPVVFLHAATGSSRVWEHQMPAFTAAGYRFIAYDRRGWGRSVVDPSGPQPGTAADDLAGLMDHLRVDRFHIVATAAGGSIAWDFALSFPQRVGSMVIANNTGRVEDQDYQRAVSSLRPEKFDELPPEFREVGPMYRASNPDGTRRWIELEHVSRPPGPRMPTQPLKNRLTFPVLERIQTPVLLISGGADVSAPAPLQRFFAERVKTAESLVVPNAGHSTYWEAPEDFNRAVLDFIRKH
jgi:pimeloyl-ACP methyl ester carboxylesterase